MLRSALCRRGRFGGARRFGAHRGRRGAGAYYGGHPPTACLFLIYSVHWGWVVPVGGAVPRNFAPGGKNPPAATDFWCFLLYSGWSGLATESLPVRRSPAVHCRVFNTEASCWPIVVCSDKLSLLPLAGREMRSGWPPTGVKAYALQNGQWVTFYEPWPTWPISQLTRDPWPMTHDSRLLTIPVTVTVWRLRTLGRWIEVSMRFRFLTMSATSP